MLRFFVKTPKEFSMKNYLRTKFPRKDSIDEMYKPVFVDILKKRILKCESNDRILYTSFFTDSCKAVKLDLALTF